MRKTINGELCVRASKWRFAKGKFYRQRKNAKRTVVEASDVRVIKEGVGRRTDGRRLVAQGTTVYMTLKERT